MFQQSCFKPAWWLKGPHLQTISAKLLTRTQPQFYTQWLSTPDDDELVLAWNIPLNPHDSRPILVMLHGLGGSIHSHYIARMMQAATQQGWLCMLMHFRGCFGGVNKQAYSYHSGDTKDIAFVSDYLTSLFPSAPKLLLGYSLGGSVVLNYLSEYQQNGYQAAAAVCAPLHLASCSARINQNSSKIYQNYLLKLLKKATLAKIVNGSISHISAQQLAAINSMYQFDQLVTAPLNGFKSADDYYQQASSRDKLKQITTNTFLLHSKDDPFLHHQQITKIKQLPKNITFEVSRHGGHVGFVTGKNPFKPQFWLEPRLIDYFQSNLAKLSS